MNYVMPSNERRPDVLETMFFAEPSPIPESAALQNDALTCRLDCTGAVTGSFSLAIDRGALHVLSEGFYGGEERSSPTADEDLARELTNMLTGAALSTYLPQESCALSSPLVSSLAEHYVMRSAVDAGQSTAGIGMDLEGGRLSLLCVLREAA